MTESAAKTVTCPNCGKKVPWKKTERFKPFCSERCKLIDLGEWVMEKKAIPGEPLNSDDELNP